MHENEILIQTKAQNISVARIDSSYLCITAERKEMTITSNLLKKSHVVPYLNIVTKNSLKIEKQIKQMNGHVFLYTRVLDKSEIEDLIKKSVRESLHSEITNRQ